jgi:hypothetical protein
MGNCCSQDPELRSSRRSLKIRELYLQAFFKSQKESLPRYEEPDTPNFRSLSYPISMEFTDPFLTKEENEAEDRSTPRFPTPQVTEPDEVHEAGKKNRNNKRRSRSMSWSAIGSIEPETSSTEGNPTD